MMHPPSSPSPASHLRDRALYLRRLALGSRLARSREGCVQCASRAARDVDTDAAKTHLRPRRALHRRPRIFCGLPATISLAFVARFRPRRLPGTAQDASCPISHHASIAVGREPTHRRRRSHTQLLMSSPVRRCGDGRVPLPNVSADKGMCASHEYVLRQPNFSIQVS